LKSEHLIKPLDKKSQDIPIIEIIDPYAYVSSGKLIAIISIRKDGGDIEQRKLVRTTKGGYVMQ
jgi:hypothetical protein